MNLAEFLKSKIVGDVSVEQNDIYRHSHDASLFEVVPEVIVYPKDALDVSNLVKAVNEWNINHSENTASITARCAGTCMSGGSINTSIILDFTKYMNKIIEVSKIESSNDGYGIVEPGCYYRDFEKMTLEQNLIMPAYTASKEICAVGGMVGNNSGGEKTIKYGKVEGHLLELEVVLNDGSIITVSNILPIDLEKKKNLAPAREAEIYRDISTLINKNKDLINSAKPNVSKNSAGYYLWNVVGENGSFDLNRLIVGSQGTLCLVTKIKFHLVPVEKYSNLLAIFMPNISRLGEIVDDILPFNPDSVESYDDYSMKLAIKFFFDFFKQMGFWNAIKLGIQFIPEAWMMLRGGVPKLILLVECTGNNEDEVKSHLEKVKSAVTKYNYKMRVAKNSKESLKYWKIRRESFNMLRKHIKGKRTAPFIDDIVVLPEVLPAFLPKLEVILKEYKLVYTIAGHAGNGNFHIIPLMDLDAPMEAELLLEISDKVYALVKEYHGSITAEHNDGIVRTPYLEEMYGAEVVTLFKQTKQIFDPNNIFNPGKKVPITDSQSAREFFRTHLSKTHSPHHPNS